MFLWQVDEWAVRNYQESQLFKHLPSRGRHKSISNSRDVDQLLSLVISNDDGVETVSAREVSADHQFLSAIDPIFDPRATSLSGFVAAIFSLADNSFKP
jgi:hypothetical protein